MLECMRMTFAENLYRNISKEVVFTRGLLVVFMLMISRYFYSICTSLWERKLPGLIYIYWNRFLLWLNGVEVGHNCIIRNHIYMTFTGGKYGVFRIGNNFILSSGGGWNPLSRGLKAHLHIENDAKLVIGDNVGISSSCIWCANSITIGNNTNIGANSIILDTDCHSIDWLVRRMERDMSYGEHNRAKTAPIYIGDDVMIGCNVIVLKGVTIGSRSVIAACSVVVNDVPEDSVVGGNPAVLIKK